MGGVRTRKLVCGRMDRWQSEKDSEHTAGLGDLDTARRNERIGEGQRADFHVSNGIESVREFCFYLAFSVISHENTRAWTKEHPPLKIRSPPHILASAPGASSSSFRRIPAQGMRAVSGWALAKASRVRACQSLLRQKKVWLGANLLDGTRFMAHWVVI